jgi:hypothetical protein
MYILKSKNKRYRVGWSPSEFIQLNLNFNLPHKSPFNIISFCSIDTSDRRRIRCLTHVDVSHRHNTGTCDYIQVIHIFKLLLALKFQCHIWCLCLSWAEPPPGLPWHVLGLGCYGIWRRWIVKRKSVIYGIKG